MSIAARNAMLAGGAELPYDAEVEYLESTGTQYIDTGLYGTQNTVADFRFQSALPQNPSRGFGIFGARSRWANRQFYLSADKDYLKFVCGWGNNQSLGVCISDVDAQTLDWHTVHIAQTWSIDSFSAPFSYYSFKTSNPLVVFQTWLSDTSLWYNESMKCSYLQIRESGKLVLDFIPVRVGSGASAVGYMYDRVSGHLFGNAGTGAFVIGPDK